MAVGEWDQRQLCPDGACVGVIGPDGTCKVCGRAAQNWGDERKRGLIDPPDEDEVDGDEDEGDGDAAAAGAGDDGPDEDEGDEDEGDEDEGDEGEDDEDGDGDLDRVDRPPVLAAPREWGSRQLCPDGTCIGVIGPNGRCKVCGRRAEDAVDAGSSSSSSAPANASTGEPDEHSSS